MKKTAGKTPSRETVKKKTARERPEPAEPHDLLTDLRHAGMVASSPGAASQKGQTLGVRVRNAREMRGLTLGDLSNRSGIAVETLERVESEKANLPLGELKLGKALDMKMGYLISPGVEKSMTVVRAGSRTTVSRHGAKVAEQFGYVYQSLAPQKANRLMEPFLVTMVPTDFEQLSSHDGQEFIFVLEGEISARVAGETELLHPGDAVYYDSSQPHLVKCAGGKPAKILAVLHTGSK